MPSSSSVAPARETRGQTLTPAACSPPAGDAGRNGRRFVHCSTSSPTGPPSLSETPPRPRTSACASASAPTNRSVKVGLTATQRGSPDEAGRDLRPLAPGRHAGETATNSWGNRHYPNQWLDAASLVCSKAVQIMWRSARVFSEFVEPSHRDGVHGVRSASERLPSMTIPRHRGWLNWRREPYRPRPRPPRPLPRAAWKRVPPDRPARPGVG